MAVARLEAKFGEVFSFGNIPADHTYVKLYDGDKCIQDFCCFGGSSGTKTSISKECFADASKILNVFDWKEYLWWPKVRGTKDSTRMIYLTNGVCHQAANRFLIPAKCVMPDKKEGPRGITVTYATFGLRGTNYRYWRDNNYNPSCRKFGMEEAYQGVNVNSVETSLEEELFIKAALLHEQNSMNTSMTSIDMILEESQIYIETMLSSNDGHPALKMHRQYLEERDLLIKKAIWLEGDIATSMEVIRTISMKEIEDFVNKSNDIAFQFQHELNAAMGDEAYLQLCHSKKLYPLASLEQAAWYLHDYIEL